MWRKPKLVQAVDDSAVAGSPKADPDRALLEDLARSPHFGALVEHFRLALDDSLMRQSAAIGEQNQLKLAEAAALVNSHLGTLRWLQRYAPKETHHE